MRPFRFRCKLPTSILPKYLRPTTPQLFSNYPPSLSPQFPQQLTQQRSYIHHTSTPTLQFPSKRINYRSSRHFSTEPQAIKPLPVENPQLTKPQGNGPELVAEPTPPPSSTSTTQGVTGTVQKAVPTAAANIEKTVSKEAPTLSTQPPLPQQSAQSAQSITNVLQNEAQQSTIQSTTQTTIPPQSTLSKLPQKPLKKTFSQRISSFLTKAVIFAGCSMLLLDFIANRWRYMKIFHRIYRNQYIPLTSFNDLYTYSAEVIYRDELTFELNKDDLQNNLSVYQLLILKDIYAINMFLDELSLQITRLRERYPELDTFGKEESFLAHQLLATIRNHLTTLSISAELACHVETNPEKIPGIETQDQYIAKLAPSLYSLEEYWCQTSAAKDLCEQLLPQLEHYMAELLVWNTKNQNRFNDPIYLQQLSINPHALPAPAIVPEIPFDKWKILFTNYESNVKEAVKTFVTKPTEATMRSPLTPKQQKLRDSSFRTSAKVHFLPINDRRLDSLLRNYQEEQNAMYLEQERVEKVRLETKKERQERREKQIEERFHNIKRTERVQAAVDRVTKRLHAGEQQGNLDPNDPEIRNQVEQLMKKRQEEYDDEQFERMSQLLAEHSGRIERKLLGTTTLKDEVAELKEQMTQQEMELFNQRHPEVADIEPHPLRTRSGDL